MLRGRYPGFFKRQIIRIFKKRGRNFYEKERVKKFKRSILDSYSNKPDMKKHKYTGIRSIPGGTRSIARISDILL